MTVKSIKRITSDKTFNLKKNLCWSPDGTKLAFVGTRDGNPEIYLCEPDGSGIRRITNDPGMDEWPSWSPDGKQIAFHSNREGSWGIYIMDADGKSVRRLSPPNCLD